METLTRATPPAARTARAEPALATAAPVKGGGVPVVVVEGWGEPVPVGNGAVLFPYCAETVAAKAATMATTENCILM